MRLRIQLPLLVLALYSIDSSAKNHVLKKGETLASVAREYYGEPVWGPKGTIKKIYKLNPWALNTPNLVEPGQTVVIDDESASAVPAPVVNAEPAVVNVQVLTKEPVALPAIEEMKKLEPPPFTAPATGEPASAVETEPRVKTKSTENAPEPTAAQSAAPAANSTVNSTVSSGVKVKSYFFVVPYFVTSKISTSTDPAATSYDLNSNSTYGFRLGWDHWWTKTFSTIASYSLGQMKSTATNDTTTDTFANAMNYNSMELALLNRVGSNTRLGLGLAYGTHIFVEGFSSTPANQSIYSTTFWNPFLLVDINLLSTEKIDLLLDLKAAPIPADVGHDHDLKSGMEYTVKISVLEKLGNSAFSLGLSYSQNDQSRIGTQQTRTDTAVEIGFLF